MLALECLRFLSGHLVEQVIHRSAVTRINKGDVIGVKPSRLLAKHFGRKPSKIFKRSKYYSAKTMLVSRNKPDMIRRALLISIGL